MNENLIAVIYLGRKGAGPAYAYEMTKGLINNGANVIVFISEYIENIESWKKLDLTGLEIIKTSKSTVGFVPNTIRFRIKDYARLKKKYKQYKFSACYIPMGNVWDDFIVNCIGNPLKFYTLHDPISHSSDVNLKNSLIKAVGKALKIGVPKKKSDYVIILSEQFKKYTSERFRLPEEHVIVIPHGLFELYKEVDNGNEFEYDKTKINFLFWGRITSYKGLDILAEAYKKLKEENHNISLTIVGSGDFTPYEDMF